MVIVANELNKALRPFLWAAFMLAERLRGYTGTDSAKNADWFLKAFDERFGEKKDV
jgi:hypothetical protein